VIEVVLLFLEVQMILDRLEVGCRLPLEQALVMAD